MPASEQQPGTAKPTVTEPAKPRPSECHLTQESLPAAPALPGHPAAQASLSPPGHHIPLHLPPPNPLWKRQAQSWRVLHPFQNTGARAQQLMERRFNWCGSHHSSDKEARGSRRKCQSCGYFCPGKAALLCTSIIIHSLFLKGYSTHAAQPSKPGVAGHTLLPYPDKKAKTEKSCRNPAEP